MSDLSKERVLSDKAPFANVGVDYFDPLDVRRGRTVLKRYGVIFIFTCLSSCAIHLEVAHSLDTDSCINAVRRFICRRGPVTTMRLWHYFYWCKEGADAASCCLESI